ncbi:MAG: ABC transporter ATP-binding protein [Kiritimatiellae bacterium]|nr:ABC transporter ATP-binding protein [Kiritimatiellia bacterium]
MSAILSVKGLAKSFGDADARIDVIRRLDLELEAGAFEAVMGPSGSGKSTLLHLLAGLLPADAGEIVIAGTAIQTLSDAEATLFRRRHIGLVFQDFNLVPTLTAEENIALPMLLDHRSPDPADITHVMDLLGLSARRRHLPDRLSGGERQRVAIARALAGHPSIVLADEPTGNLDSPAARDFCHILQKMNHETGTSILMVSHDPVVSAAAGRVHILRDGRFLDAFDTAGDPALVSARYLQAIQSQEPAP